MSEVTVWQPKDTLPSLTRPVQQILEAIQENMGNTKIDTSKLQTLKIPSGGQSFFEVDVLEGSVAVKELYCVILYSHNGRAYWSKKYGASKDEDQSPDCQSTDGENGVGKPGGKCLTCQFDKFGTARKDNGELGAGKACSDQKYVYILRPDSMVPDRLRLPSTSKGNIDAYLWKLSVTNAIKAHSVLTKVVLKVAENNDGVKYSEAEFSFVRKLSAEELANVEGWRELSKALQADEAERVVAKQLPYSSAGPTGRLPESPIDVPVESVGEKKAEGAA